MFESVSTSDTFKMITSTTLDSGVNGKAHMAKAALGFTVRIAAEWYLGGVSRFAVNVLMAGATVATIANGDRHTKRTILPLTAGYFSGSVYFSLVKGIWGAQEALYSAVKTPTAHTYFTHRHTSWMNVFVHQGAILLRGQRVNIAKVRLMIPFVGTSILGLFIKREGIDPFATVNLSELRPALMEAFKQEGPIGAGDVNLALKEHHCQLQSDQFFRSYPQTEGITLNHPIKIEECAKDVGIVFFFSGEGDQMNGAVLQIIDRKQPWIFCGADGQLHKLPVSNKRLETLDGLIKASFGQHTNPYVVKLEPTPILPEAPTEASPAEKPQQEAQTPPTSELDAFRQKLKTSFNKCGFHVAMTSENLERLGYTFEDEELFIFEDGSPAQVACTRLTLESCTDKARTIVFSEWNKSRGEFKPEIVVLRVAGPDEAWTFCGPDGVTQEVPPSDDRAATIKQMIKEAVGETPYLFSLQPIVAEES